MLQRKFPFYVLISLTLIFTFQSCKIYVKATLAQYLIASAWSESQTTGQTIRPWTWADTYPVLKLAFKNGESQFVLKGLSGQALAFGPAHLNASALPGQNKEITIAAHRDTHFSDLKDTLLNDTFTLETIDKNIFTYQVVATRIIDTRKEKLIIDNQQEVLRLITCYPFDAISPGGPLRYEVIAIPVIPKNNQQQLHTAL